MTIITENEYIKLAKDLFIELLKKTDEFASENNINTEKLLSLNAIFHICNRLPKTKEKILKVINKHQNIKLKLVNYLKKI